MYSKSNKTKTIAQEIESDLFIKNMFLVDIIARQFVNKLINFDIDILKSAGNVGLLDAIRKFDHSKNIEFNTYASIRITGSIQDEIRSIDKMTRLNRKRISMIDKRIWDLEKRFNRAIDEEEIAESLGISLDNYYIILSKINNCIFFDEINNYFQEYSFENALSLIIRNESNKNLWKVINKLSDRDRQIIYLYYLEDKDMKEIGQIMGYSESRISQIHTKIILKLRERLNI